MFHYSSPRIKKKVNYRTLSQTSHRLFLNNSNSYNPRFDIDSNNKKNSDNDLKNYLRIFSAKNKNNVNKLKNNLIDKSKIKNKLLKSTQLKYLSKSKILKNNINFFNTVTLNIFNKKEEKEKINKIDTKIILNEHYKRDIKAEINEHSESDLIKYRTEYILKYAQISDFFKHILNSYKETIDIDRSYNFGIYLINEDKLFEIMNRLILEEIKCDVPLEYLTWRNLLNYFFEFSNEFTNILNFLFEEIKILQNKNLDLEQKLFDKENELQIKLEELNEVNNIIKKFDLTAKKKEEEKKEKNIKKIKLRAAQNENAYIITIYRLEDEIKNLTELLKKNKININEIEILKNQNNAKIKEIDNIRNDYNQELNDMHAKISFLKDKIEEIKEDKKKLKEENENLKNDNENKKHRISILEKDKEDLNINLHKKEEKIILMQNTILSIKNKENNNNIENNDMIENFINNPVLSVMTISHNV